MLQIGAWNTLKVIRSKEHGIYLGEEDGKTAETVLLPRKQVPEGVRIGETMRVFLYRDSEDRMIATTTEPYIIMGEIKKLTVKHVTNIGAFMDWGLEKDILLPFKEQTAKLSEGKSYLVRMYADKSGRLCVSMKLYGYLESAEALEKGQSFTGTVYEYKKGLGAFVAIEDRYSGLIHEDELYSRVLVGDVVSGRVTNVRPDGKADLSLRAPAYKQMNEDSEMVYAIIRSYKDGLPFNDKADKEIIKKEFGLSKNAFKRAVGHLLKEGKIEITDHSILIK
ncbi:MAG: S1-like domain-containing RNA-binding protein [Eubacteriales bacterium]|nr:S1-like domain-containing RNA-binding protein [Eubacteriales bacterium]